jgi:hypothetical protein
MTRRAFFGSLCAVAVTPNAVHAAGFHITGKMDATDQEAQEGYFSIGKDVMIVTRPNSPVHDDLRSMIGSQVQCSVFVP